MASEPTTEQAFIKKCRAEFTALLRLADDRCIYQDGKRVSLATAVKWHAAVAIKACDNILQDKT